MLVKVGLSYYMEGEHRQVQDFQGCWIRGLMLGGGAWWPCASDGDGTGKPLTPRKRGTGGPLTLPERSGPLLSILEGCCREDRCPNVGVCLGARKGKCLGCWDRRDARRRLRPGARFWRLRMLLGGTAGRPGAERLMRLPCRMCPLGMGSWPGSRGGGRCKGTRR